MKATTLALSLLVLAAPTALFAADAATPTTPTPTSAATAAPQAATPVATNAAPKIRLPRGMRRYGGIINVPNSQKGTIVIVNAQKRLPVEKLRAGMDEFAKSQKFNVKFVDGAATTPETATDDMKKIGADVAVFIQENPESKITLLNAPEQRWTILNVSAITADARNDVFAAARIRKELTRGFLCAAGAMNSQYQGSLMAAIREPKDLDKMIEDPPIDAIQRAIDALRVYGVTPQEVTTYKKACQSGWAPAPTNEWQQAIWDQVHEIPKNPIKIKFDPKKDK